MRSKSSSFNAGFLLDGPLGLELSRARANSTVQSRAANFKIKIGFPRRGVAALSAKRLCRDGGALMPVPVRSASRE
jgi:hypothetical protein